MDEEDLQMLYVWVDQIPLSRPKRNIARDFSDGVLVAEVVYHYIPKLVELHNYSSAHASNQKMYNWATLNQKVFKKLGFVLTRTEMEAVVSAEPGAVERVLFKLRIKIGRYQTAGPPQSATPGSARVGSARGSRESNGYDTPSTAPRRMGDLGAGDMSAGPDPEKDRQLAELTETVEILEAKSRKLEQLVRLKDAKIQTLQNRLTAAGLG